MAMVSIDSTQLMIRYGIFLLIGMGFFIMLLSSFLPAWLSVRRSGGNKVLVHIANPLMDYYKAGKVDNGFLYYKARKRVDNPDPNRMLWVGDIRNFTYKSFGVNVIDVDDIKNCIWSRYGTSTVSPEGVSSNYDAVSTNNAEAYDEAQYTALHKPSTKKAMFDEYTWQMISLFAFVLIIAGIIFVYRQFAVMEGQHKMIYDSITPISNYIFNSTGVA
jgi:hypothetical protein